jgi:hypothetical protein
MDRFSTGGFGFCSMGGVGFCSMGGFGLVSMICAKSA